MLSALLGWYQEIAEAEGSMEHCFELTNNICWRVTRRCNKKCEFCLSNSGPELRSRRISLEGVYERLAFLGVTKISYAGGEPFLYPQLQEMLMEGHRVGIEQVVTSNGDFIHSDNLNQLAKIDVLRLSFYGLAEGHDRIMGEGHFNKLIELIKELDGTGQKVASNIMISQTSLPHLEELIALLSQVGASQILLLAYIESGNSEIDERYRIKKSDLDIIPEKIHFTDKKPEYGVRIIDFTHSDFYCVLDEKLDFHCPSGVREHDIRIGNLFDSEFKHCIFGTLPAKEMLKKIWTYRNGLNLVKEL